MTVCDCTITDHPRGRYTGREGRYRITYILRDSRFGMRPHYAILSIVPAEVGVPYVSASDRIRAELERRGIKPVATLTCPFLNNDVPEFLKALDAFESSSRKDPLIIK
jgi:hypothetical protein